MDVGDGTFTPDFRAGSNSTLRACGRSDGTRTRIALIESQVSDSNLEDTPTLPDFEDWNAMVFQHGDHIFRAFAARQIMMKCDTVFKVMSIEFCFLE